MSPTEAQALPLGARALVVTGGEGSNGYDEQLPIACGIPTADVPASSRSAQTEALAATNEIQASALQVQELADSGEIDSAQQQQIDQALEQLDGTDQQIAQGIDNLQALIDASAGADEPERPEQAQPAESEGTQPEEDSAPEESADSGGCPPGTTPNVAGGEKKCTGEGFSCSREPGGSKPCSKSLDKP